MATKAGPKGKTNTGKGVYTLTKEDISNVVKFHETAIKNLQYNNSSLLKMINDIDINIEKINKLPNYTPAERSKTKSILRARKKELKAIYLENQKAIAQHIKEKKQFAEDMKKL